MSAIIVLLILVVVAVVVINLYNRLAQLRLRCDSAWSDIDVQLKRRQDLIPELIDTVKGHAPQEQAVFEKIGDLRSRAMQATGPADQAAAEGELGAALQGVLAVVERHPELKASEQFKPLQTALNLAESSLHSAQRYYNSVVTDWNSNVRSFPASVLAGVFGFAPRQLFEADENQADESQGPSHSISE
jgi:LemA protein